LFLGEYDKRVWGIVGRHVAEARRKADYSGVEAVGVDETSRCKGHSCITVFADMKTGGDAIFATIGKGADTLGEFAADLSAHSGSPQKIGEIAMDMSPSFISGAASRLSNAQTAYDKFHVAEIVNDAVDKAGREEQKINPC
jgi:transposase